MLSLYLPLKVLLSNVLPINMTPRNLLKDLLNRAGELPVVLIFDNCNLYEIVAYDWLYSQYWGRVKIIDNAWKHRRLAFVFSLLVWLIWFCKTRYFCSFKLQNLISTIFALMYGGKPHAKECIFQWSRLFKIKNSSLDKTMVGPHVATKPWNFHSPEPLPLLPKPLENLGGLSNVYTI